MNTAVDPVRAYHQRTKHQLQRYAAGPDTLDWDAQPSPFRQWAGSPTIELPLVADQLRTTWSALHDPAQRPPLPLSLETIACLLELSFALTAWKQFGPDRWALRANPSSGNLHPTEVYLIAAGVAGLPDGLYHYDPRDHLLARRARYSPAAAQHPALWLGLSSIQWREAWKYGERAFRYCQLDAGHALGALAYAAAALGWSARKLTGVTHADVAGALGLDRADDFGVAEREEPEMLVGVGPARAGHKNAPDQHELDQHAPDQHALDSGALGAHPRFAAVEWWGQASQLDPRPMYRWPVIQSVSDATRLLTAREGASADLDAEAEVATFTAPRPRLPTLCDQDRAADLIRGRRSAQHFDRRAQLPRAAFERIVAALLPHQAPPWSAWPHAVRVHPVLYVHRVDGVTPGAYVLPRSAVGEARLRQQLRAASAWEPVASEGPAWPLWRLAEHPALAGALRTLSCHQAIASDACLALSLVAEFDAELGARPDGYRLLLQEAGLIGQGLYLQAEAEGYRGTGIGCYFDDAVHELLGIEGTALQVLYHFTIGQAMVDSRISTAPPYAHLADRAGRLPGEPT